MTGEKEIKELESRVIERAKFWNDFINMLVAIRDNAGRIAEQSSPWQAKTDLQKFREAMQEAINAAMSMQNQDLAQCFLLAGVGGERADQYAKELAQKVLGKHLDYAVTMGYVPTFWVEDKK